MTKYKFFYNQTTVSSIPGKFYITKHAGCFSHIRHIVNNKSQLVGSVPVHNFGEFACSNKHFWEQVEFKMDRYISRLEHG